MTRAEFKKQWNHDVGELFAPDGFVFDPVDGFYRARNGIWEMFGWILDRSVMNFWLEVGIHIPSLRDKSKFINQLDCAFLEIGNRLGAPPAFKGGIQRFGFRNSLQLRQAIQKMHTQFVQQALPWLQTFRGLTDVADYFYKQRLSEPIWCPASKAMIARPPDAMGWAFYGWMLEVLKRPDEAKRWLERAYTELQRPLYMKNGKMVEEGTRGAQLIRRSDAGRRVEELIRQSLSLPMAQ